MWQNGVWLYGDKQFVEVLDASRLSRGHVFQAHQAAALRGKPTITQRYIGTIMQGNMRGALMYRSWACFVASCFIQSEKSLDDYQPVHRTFFHVNSTLVSPKKNSTSHPHIWIIVYIAALLRVQLSQCRRDTWQYPNKKEWRPSRLAIHALG